VRSSPFFGSTRTAHFSWSLSFPLGTANRLYDPPSLIREFAFPSPKAALNAVLLLAAYLLTFFFRGLKQRSLLPMDYPTEATATPSSLCIVCTAFLLLRSSIAWSENQIDACVVPAHTVSAPSSPSCGIQIGGDVSALLGSPFIFSSSPLPFSFPAGMICLSQPPVLRSGSILNHCSRHLPSFLLSSCRVPGLFFFSSPSQISALPTGY